MRARYLLDTNVVSEPLAATPIQGVLDRLQRHREELAISSIVWHELVFGARRLPAGKRRRVIEAYLSEVVAPTLPVFPYDTPAAQWHAEERARLQGQGLTPAFADGQIAAVARVNGLVLVTRNVSNFEPFTDVAIENWFSAPEATGGALQPEPRRGGSG